MERRARTIKADIPVGIDNGQTISLRGQGHAGTNGGGAGDLHITVTVRPHEIFRREGNSVLCEAPITFAQAALGAEMEIPTIDGKVKYDIPEGTQSGTTFRLRGKGIPNLGGKGRGDQYVRVNVEVPKRLNRTQRDALKKFEETLKDENYEQRKGFFKTLKEMFGTT
ncbi:Chaperone protein DnaJ [bioreactor metagenome]|uniref:Chaperone protein DnaJ n=1 Tax=bioreactor metagenome TaxID=1076179 RepID=A0A645DIB3_9ZZZZ